MNDLILWESRWYVMHGYRARLRKMASGVMCTVYEHRLVMAEALGRDLTPDEMVHHIDGNRLNNAAENLCLMTAREHGLEHAKRAPLLALVCVGCGADFVRVARHERHNRKQNKRGPYCSRRCAGRFARPTKSGPFKGVGSSPTVPTNNQEDT